MTALELDAWLSANLPTLDGYGPWRAMDLDDPPQDVSFIASIVAGSAESPICYAAMLSASPVVEHP